MRSPRRTKVDLMAAGVLAALLVAAPAHAAVLVVDDDNVACVPGAAFHTINAALAVAEVKDELRICPGVYAEQVVLTKSLTLRGLGTDIDRPIVRPTVLPVSRPSTQGAMPIAAAILVDAARVTLEGLEVDLGAATIAGCSPIIAGIYLRNASGELSGMTVTLSLIHI